MAGRTRVRIWRNSGFHSYRGRKWPAAVRPAWPDVPKGIRPHRISRICNPKFRSGLKCRICKRACSFYLWVMGSAYRVKDQENTFAVTAAIFMKSEKDVCNWRWYSGWHIHPIRKSTCPSEHVAKREPQTASSSSGEIDYF